MFQTIILALACYNAEPANLQTPEEAVVVQMKFYYAKIKAARDKISQVENDLTAVRNDRPTSRDQAAAERKDDEAKWRRDPNNPNGAFQEWMEQLRNPKGVRMPAPPRGGYPPRPSPHVIKKNRQMAILAEKESLKSAISELSKLATGKNPIDLENVGFGTFRKKLRVVQIEQDRGLIVQEAATEWTTPFFLDAPDLVVWNEGHLFQPSGVWVCVGKRDYVSPSGRDRAAYVFKPVSTRLIEEATAKVAKQVDVPAPASPVAETPKPEPTPAAEQPKPEPPLVEELAKPDPARSRWLNETYDQTISHVQGTQWVERFNKTQKISTRLTETDRTPDYVELSGFVFGVGRLFPQRLVLKKGDKWEWASTGHWDKAVGIPVGPAKAPADSDAGDPFKK